MHGADDSDAPAELFFSPFGHFGSCPANAGTGSGGNGNGTPRSWWIHRRTIKDPGVLVRDPRLHTKLQGLPMSANRAEIHTEARRSRGCGTGGPAQGSSCDRRARFAAVEPPPCTAISLKSITCRKFPLPFRGTQKSRQIAFRHPAQILHSCLTLPFHAFAGLAGALPSNFTDEDKSRTQHKFRVLR